MLNNGQKFIVYETDEPILCMKKVSNEINLEIKIFISESEYRSIIKIKVKTG